MTHTILVRLLATCVLTWTLIAACAPAAAPTPAPAKPPATAAPKPTEKVAAQPAPAKPTEAPKPAEAAKPVAKPTDAPAAKPAAKRPTTPAEIFAYSGPDRQQILEEGARKEGKLLWYTSLIIQDRARPLAEAFRQKYPFVQVDIVRVEGGEAMTRVTEEYRARKYDVDFFEQSFPATIAFKEAKILAKLHTPMVDRLPKDAQDPDGFFYADRENPLILAYNTTLVPAATAPKTFDDLLSPQWKGKQATQDSSQAVQYTGAMLHLKGEEFLRKLAQQDVTVHSGSARAVVDLVVAGEFHMTFPASISHGQLMEKQGAPMGWSPLEPVPTATGYVSVASQAPHPHAAALLADFLLSDAGQEAMVKTEMGAVRTGVKNPYPDFKKSNIDFLVPQQQYSSEYKKWSELHTRLFVKRGM